MSQKTVSETKYRTFLSTPACWGISSKVLNADTLDSKFFNVELLQTLANLEMIGKVKELGSQKLAIIARGRPVKEAEEGVGKKIPILKVANLSNYGIKWDRLDFVGETTRIREDEKPATIRNVNVGDILILSAGHTPDVIGEKADIISFKPYPQATFSAETLLIRVIDEAIDPYYLLAFIRSNYGKIQIKSMIRGETAHVYPHDLKRLKVLMLPDDQRRLGNYIRQAERLRKEAHQRYVFLQEKYAKPFHLDLGEECETFTIRQDEIARDQIFDIEFYSKLRKAEEALKKCEYRKKSLSKLAELAKRRKPRGFRERDFFYIEINNIDEMQGDIVSWSEIHGSIAPSRAQRLLKAGDILVSTVRTYRGAIALVPEYLDLSIGSSGFAVLTAKEEEIKKEVLWFILRTPVCLVQMSRLLAGGLYPAIVGKKLLEITVPVPPPEIQETLSREIQEMHRLRQGMIFLNQQSRMELESKIEQLTAESKGQPLPVSVAPEEAVRATFEILENDDLKIKEALTETSEWCSLDELKRELASDGL